jgi:AGZA family xanthine/uracil permease-like MFS transporter
MTEKKATSISGFFKLNEHKTNIRTEILAGVTTFFAMAYIILVNPSFLSQTGMDFGAVFVATCLSAALGTLLMGVIANYPIALAPGMGLNAYFTFAVCLGMGIPWQKALGAVFISGVIFLLLTVTKVREMIINSIPASLKFAVSAGIGLFIAFIGMKNAGLIVANEATFIALNPKLSYDPNLLLTIFGLVFTVILMLRKITGAIFIGMIVTGIIGVLTGLIAPPTGVFSMPPSMAPTFLQMDVMGALELGLFAIVFSFLFVDLFDNAGTLVGVANQAGLLKDNKLPKAGRALVTDSVATMAGASMGTSTVTSYIESASGVASGGRTGLTSVVTSICLTLSVFFFPLVKAFAGVAAITSPALIIVGVLMAGSLRNIRWDEFAEAVPAFLTMVMMPFTYSIATGIAVGFILYPVCQIIMGNWKKVHPIMYVLAVLFVLRFIYVGAI